MASDQNVGDEAFREAGQEPGVDGPSDALPSGPGAAADRNVIDASVDLIETTLDYVRQELAKAVREKAVTPAQQTALDVAILLAMALVIFLGVGFLAAGLLKLLADLVGWTAAFFIVGFVLVVFAIIVMAVVQSRLKARRDSL